MTAVTAAPVTMTVTAVAVTAAAVTPVTVAAVLRGRPRPAGRGAVRR
ncbi:hypothetical protein [Planomonospora sphaerica]|nr:hypothetical protein [Planomonospora sphaerica]